MHAFQTYIFAKAYTCCSAVYLLAYLSLIAMGIGLSSEQVFDIVSKQQLVYVIYE